MTTANVVMCDKFPDRPAVARFTGCGTQGACSAEYQFQLRQIAEQTNQPLDFHPLAVAAPELGQDERTQLLAARMSADIETGKARDRARDLYNQNNELKEGLRKATLRATQAEQSNERLTSELASLQSKFDALSNEHADLKETHSALEAAVGPIAP